MSFRKSAKNRRASLLIPTEYGTKTGIVFFSISLFVHGLVFGGLIFFQDFSFQKPMEPVIQIDLVSFSPEPVPEGEPDASAKDPVPSKDEGLPVNPPPVKEAPPKKIPTIKPDISLKSKPANLKELMAKKVDKKKPPKKKTIEKRTLIPKPDPEKRIESATKELEKKVEAQTRDRIAEALSRLKKQVKSQGSNREGEPKGLSGSQGRKGYKPIDLYHLVIASTIEQNWVFNDILAKMDQNLEVRILIKILKSGEIRDVIFETKSGNRYLDESAKKAIKKANPLPPLPAGLRSYDVGLIFTPRGLK